MSRYQKPGAGGRLGSSLCMLAALAVTVPIGYFHSLSSFGATYSTDVKFTGVKSFNRSGDASESNKRNDEEQLAQGDQHSEYQGLAWEPALEESENNMPKALKHVLNRKEEYRRIGDDDRWPLRGLGYLYVTRRMVLEARTTILPSVQSSHGERRVVQIQNVMKDGLLKGSECDKLTLWVRVRGPEIFAGRARAVEGDPCYWELPFDLQVSGEYEVDVKTIIWNGGAKIIANNEEDAEKFETNKSFVPHIQCPYEVGGSAAVEERHEYAVQEGFQGFKVYDPVHTCCEVCSRLRPHCKHWATPPAHFDANRINNGCELYYDSPENKIPTSKLLPDRVNITAESSMGGRKQRRQLGPKDVPVYNGPPHSNEVAYFMGCGWSSWFTLDYPCMDGDMDDRIFVVEPTFTFGIQENNDHVKVDASAEVEDLPLCTLDHEDLDSVSGRWVRGAYPDSTSCPLPVEDNPNVTSFKINLHDPDRPHCWHRDDFSRIGLKCLEMNCNLITPESRAITSLHEEKEWFGIWRPYTCDYLEYSDDQLQQCFHQKNISSISTEGKSIAQFLRYYLKTRLRNISMYEGVSGRSVILKTLGLLHRADHSDKALNDWVREIPQPTEGEDVYWVTAFFLSSERKFHAHISRLDWLNHLVAGASTGHKMINAFDMSTAMTYDTATQMDGMHIIGPTMKMVVTKLFHHLCGDSVGGTRPADVLKH